MMKQDKQEFQGFDEELKDNQVLDFSEKSEEKEKKRKPFAVWEVGGREYRMKLTTSVICQLEEKYKRNLLNLLDGVPPLAVMLTITQAAMKKWEHGIKYADVQNLFDRYCEEGGTQMTFMTDVLLEIYRVSGFFSEDQQAAMDVKLEEAKELL